MFAPADKGLDLEDGFKVYSQVMTSYRISEAARRIGLPTSTLRYYERIGLLPEPERTGSGYRAYEERALDRLAFIARAKSLGLRLDAIGELADLWDAERCGPVQERLRSLIAAKVTDVKAQTEALMALATELSSVASGLPTPAPDAPCGKNCGCQPEVPPAASLDRSLAFLPALGSALACTLNGDELAGRLAEWRALATTATDRTSIEGGIRMTFRTGDIRAIADLVVRELGCCSFLEFAIGVTSAGTTLDITGPAVALPMIEALA